VDVEVAGTVERMMTVELLLPMLTVEVTVPILT
jgi:hypothetical protein